MGCGAANLRRRVRTNPAAAVRAADRRGSAAGRILLGAGPDVHGPRTRIGPSGRVGFSTGRGQPARLRKGACKVRIGNLSDRLVLITDKGAIDVEKSSAGRLGPA